MNFIVPAAEPVILKSAPVATSPVNTAGPSITSEAFNRYQLNSVPVLLKVFLLSIISGAGFPTAVKLA